MTIEMDTKWQYQQALWELSECILQRNQVLLRLNTLTALPLYITPSQGFVAAFDTGQARTLLGMVDEHTAKIADAIAKANHFGGLCGASPVEWRTAPLFRNGLDGDDGHHPAHR